jgi:hypothetical protein
MPAIDFGSASMVTNIAAQAQADLQPVYLHGPWQCQPLTLAVPAWSLTLQPRHKLIYSRCTCMGLGNASHLFAWAWARLYLICSHGQSRHRQVALLTCPMDLDQAQAQAGKATYMPLALLLALQPRQQQLIRCPRT